MKPSRSSLPVLAVILLAWMAAAAGAQEPETEAAAAPEGQEGVFFESVDVNLVNVEVFVTDRRGNPITGLTREDFELYEDGRLMRITNFYAVEGGQPTAAGEGEAQPRVAEVPVRDTPAGEVAATAAPAAEIPEDQRLYLVVYIDNYNIRPFNRNRVFRRLREFLTDKLSPEDRVMLVSYDRSLHQRHPFTGDPELVAQALFELEEMTGHGVHVDSDRRDLLRAIEEAQSIGEVQWRVRTFAESNFNDLSFTIDAMKEIVDSLAGLPGRKALLYVSDGIPQTPGEELYYALQQKFNTTIVLSEMREFDASRRFNQLATQANSNRVTFYTIDAAGLRAPSAGSVERATAGQAGVTGFLDQVQISNLQAPLLSLAEATGGQAIINTNNVGPSLDRVATDFKTYYSLGYLPAHSGDGRFYPIEVRLKEKRKGVRIRHRTGYRDKPMGTRMADGTMATLQYGYSNNPLGIGLAFGQNLPDEKNFFLVPIVIEIPLDKLVLIPQTDFHEGRVKVFFAAMDEEGGLADVQEIPLPVRIPNGKIETALNQLYPYEVRLRMRPGPHRIAVGVVDEIGSTTSFVSETFVVGG